MVLIGLAVIPLVAGDRKLAGMIAGAFGMVIALIGANAATGAYRFTFNNPVLASGIGFIPPIIGLFAIAEMLRLIAEGEESISDYSPAAGSYIEGAREVLKHWFLVVRSSVVGIFAGIIPGVGGSLATFLAYSHAVQTSRDPEKFGSGAFEGVIASEAANDAKDGGQLFPTLGIGIPGSGSTAVLVIGFLLHGMNVGPNLLIDHTQVMLLIVFSLFASNILTSVIGILTVDALVKIVNVPISLLFPIIIVTGLVASFTVRSQFMDMVFAAAFGFIGLLFMYLNVSRVPVLLALILTELAEINFYTALRLGRYNYEATFFSSWLSILLVILLGITIVTAVVQSYKSQQYETEITW
jgi:putative tricarboxylic transport membrane protein